MLESLFNKVVGLTPTQVFSRKYCEIFKSTYFEEYLGMGASGILVRNWRIGAIFRLPTEIKILSEEDFTLQL